MPPKTKKRKYSALELAPTAGTISRRAANKGVIRFGTGRQNTTTVTRWADQTNLVGSTSVGVGAGYSFALSDLPGYAEFQALYDQYRIKKIEMFFIPTINSAAAPTNIGAGVKAWTAVDFDNAAVPTLSAIQQYGSAQLLKPYSQTKIAVEPRPDMTLGSTALVGVAPRNQWIDLAAGTGVPHYGVKAFVEQNAGNTQTWFVTARYTVELKHTI